MKRWATLAALLGSSVLGSSAQAARVVLDTRLAPTPTYVSGARQAQVLRDTFAPGAVPGCRDVRVTDETPGALTRPGASQVAYLIHSCGTTRLAVFEGGRRVKTLTNVGDAIGNVGDINRDGVDDLLLLANYVTRGPNTLQDASLVTLAGGQFHTIFDLPRAAVNECSGADAYASAYRVTVQPARLPVLTLQSYKGDCVAGFRLVGSEQVRGR